MSDTTSEGGRRTSTDADAYRLEQILRSSRLPKQQDEPDQGPRLSRGAGSGSERPLTTDVVVQPDAAQPREQQHQVCQAERHVQALQAGALCSLGDIVEVLLRQHLLCLWCQAQPQRASLDVESDLECSTLESALKEQVYRLAGQWEQGTDPVFHGCAFCSAHVCFDTPWL